MQDFIDECNSKIVKIFLLFQGGFVSPTQSSDDVEKVLKSIYLKAIEDAKGVIPKSKTTFPNLDMKKEEEYKPWNDCREQTLSALEELKK